MAHKSGVLEKKSSALAGNKQSLHGRRLSPIRVPTTRIKLSEIDNLLENTLGNNVEIREPLTTREAEILKLIVSGKTNKKIARSIYRSERTVEYHRNRLMRKLGAHNSADLVKRAIALRIP